MKKILTTMLLTVVCLSGLCQSSKQSNEVRVGFWNVQNLFDTINNVGVSDGLFTPQSKRKWDSRKYNEKVDMLSQVVDRMGVDLLGLCEVENREVLEDLVQRSSGNYNIVHFESCDPRGIDQAILYDPTKFKILESGLIKTSTDKPKRELLHASFLVGQDTVLFYVVHLPSKLGGAKAETNRSAIVAQLDSIVWLQRKPIVIMGDMNDDPITINGMVNCAKILQDEFVGSYTYRGVASMLDQILLTFDIKYKKLRLINNSAISYSNRSKRASDHLPLRIDLGF